MTKHIALPGILCEPSARFQLRKDINYPTRSLSLLYFKLSPVVIYPPLIIDTAPYHILERADRIAHVDVAICLYLYHDCVSQKFSTKWLGINKYAGNLSYLAQFQLLGLH